MRRNAVSTSVLRWSPYRNGTDQQDPLQLENLLSVRRELVRSIMRELDLATRQPRPWRHSLTESSPSYVIN